MPKSYQHTQTGYVIIFSLGVGLFFVAQLMFSPNFYWASMTAMIILAVCWVLFFTMTVMIDNDVLEVWFGSGLIRKRFSLKEIESCKVVRNPWYYGWGIHWIPKRGWLFNVSGFYAVEIKMKNGTKYRIGTNVPSELEDVIRKSISQ